MNRPRILVFTKFFWPEGGGAEVATYLITKEILSKCSEVVIVSGTKKPITDVLRCCKYIYWEVLKSSFKPFEWLKIFLNNNILKKLIDEADLVYIPSHTLLPLAIVAKKIKPSVKVILHLHNYQPLTYTSVILHNGKPDLKNDLIVERYEHDSIVRAVAVGVLRSTNVINTVALRYADLVICVSRRQHDILTCNIPKIRFKTAVVYNPLPSNLPLEAKSKEPTIAYLGGSSFIKGFHVALSCLYESSRRNLSVRFKLAGHYNSSALKLLKVLRSSSVNFLGKVSHDLALRICSSCWGLLFPSICEEPSPYVVMEAMAVGTMPIASRVGGVPEIVEGTPAERYLCEPGNTDCFVNRIEGLTTMNTEQLMDLGLRLREVVLRRFDVKRTRYVLVRILESLLSRAM